MSEEIPANITSKAFWATSAGHSIDVLMVESWKPGVKRLHCCWLSPRPEFQMVYCETKYLPWRLRWQNLRYETWRRFQRLRQQLLPFHK
jgi:hypothetical protein